MSGAAPAFPRPQQRGLLPRGGSAVMADRIADPDGLDDFPTQLWGSRALWARGPVELRNALAMATVWEPCCGRGTMVRPLREFGPALVHGSDVHDYGAGFDVADFLEADIPAAFEGERPDWIVSNLPFNRSVEMYLKAWDQARVGVAFLLRLQWLEGVERYASIYSPGRVTYVCPFVERLPLHEGRLDPEGGTKTAYAWFVGLKTDPRPHPPTVHIPPCRAELTRPEDWTGWPGLEPAPMPLFPADPAWPQGEASSTSMMEADRA